MRILLYGGSFDPPHNGHMNNLRAAAARVKPDKVVVMPAGVSPFKRGTCASGALRMEMCRCFSALAEEQAVPALEVSGWEVEQAERGQRNYTVLTLEMLAAEYPGAALYLAIGSDMLLTFDGWHRWQDILKLAHLVAAHGQQRPSRPPCRRGPMRKRTPAPCPPCHPARGAVPGKQRRQQP